MLPPPMLLRLKIESNKISSIFFFYILVIWKKKTKDPIDFDEKEMSMGEKKKKIDSKDTKIKGGNTVVSR